MGRLRQRLAWLRILTAVAVAAQVSLVSLFGPMPRAKPDDLSQALLIICTAHGAETIGQADSPTDKQSPDCPCCAKSCMRSLGAKLLAVLPQASPGPAPCIVATTATCRAPSDAARAARAAPYISRAPPLAI